MNQASTQQALLCRVQSRWCALPIEHVVETMRPLPVEPLAGTPPFVIGLAVIRGEAVPVIDAAVLLGGTRSVPTRFVTFKAGDRRAALAVDAVLGMRQLPSAILRDLPPFLKEAASGAVESIGTADAEVLVVLRAIRLVPEAVWASLGYDGPPS